MNPYLFMSLRVPRGRKPPWSRDVDGEFERPGALRHQSSSRTILASASKVVFASPRHLPVTPYRIGNLASWFVQLDKESTLYRETWSIHPAFRWNLPVKLRNREVNIFSMSALDLFAPGMRAYPNRRCRVLIWLFAWM